MIKEVSGYSEKQRAKLKKHNIDFVFQNFNLIDELNVFENIELPLVYLGMSSSGGKERLNEVMELMKISHRAKHFPFPFSGGQQQRVAVARAVVAKPALILADEPTGNLDSAYGEEVMGASAGNIVSLLSTEFSKLVLIANVIAWPLAWFALDKWLDNFAYQTTISWWIFALAGLIAFATIAWQAWKVALTNPVNALKYE
ncbi:MAG: ATP-binding cassette domain-containing protein [Bacteroidales bacterium]|nr:ATP-binding cassette domain-containing protein [Bacteroidales bacterium]MCF8344226.1 ATP-binding cassette domain-containing protein [Bacteroidales bacterium]MCF8350958.1 ATP-binding cassette domain-containing protein [Bacteroidales bacterium]MCF8376543.1 ATP-binding cassette domain-containing protein [Bacteroidales bacterium]MCF8400605.1 ATP-binding cassette domain-containing protein [Bacteroidales bacterium]